MRKKKKYRKDEFDLLNRLYMVGMVGSGFGRGRIMEISLVQNSKEANEYAKVIWRKWGRYLMSRGNELT